MPSSYEEETILKPDFLPYLEGGRTETCLSNTQHVSRLATDPFLKAPHGELQYYHYDKRKQEPFFTLIQGDKMRTGTLVPP